MVTRFLILTLLLINHAVACSIKSQIVSLSGPVTMVLEELNLLQDKNLKAISSFHPIAKKTNANIIAGGLFLSKTTLKSFKGANVFYDKSFELARLFKNSELQKVMSVDTVTFSSFKVVDKVLNLISPYLSKCSDRINVLKSFLKKSQVKLKKKNPLKALFYVGLITNKKPEMIMVNDGFVLSLKNLGVLKTYQTQLAYVQWSAKELKKYKDYLSIGVSDSKDVSFKLQKISSDSFNIIFRGVLIPGIRQVHFLNKLSALSFR